MAIQLIAFDFGSTTSKALVASAELTRNAVTGRTEIHAQKTKFRGEPVFTPFEGDEIDETRLSKLVDQWMRAAGPADDPEATVAGGVIITGLAAKKRNAKAIAESVRRRIGDAVVAVADDPGKESWLAFMGSCSALSASQPQRSLINLDIGGGTTNLALGLNQSVLSTGSLWVGARHFRFAPGTYQLEGLSTYALRILKSLKISARVGESLNATEVAQIVDYYVRTLCERVEFARQYKNKFMDQLPFPMPAQKFSQPPIITFSGGVGELVYRRARGETFSTTTFGDLGVELAEGILESPLLARDHREFVPANLGRATVSGLAFHGVEASGATVFLRRPETLPLRDLPLIGRLSDQSTQSEIDRLIAAAKRYSGGSCLRVMMNEPAIENLRDLAGKFARALRKNRFPKGLPLIIFIAQNQGKTFGQYATDWGRIDADLVVIDEIENTIVDEKAYFAAISKSDRRARHGAGHQNILVSFYGGIENA